MKKIVFIIVLLLTLILRSNAQLSISPYTYTIYSDTVAANSLDSADVWIVNNDSIAFNDNLQLVLDVQDSAAAFFHNVDSLNLGLLNIPSGDSVLMRVYQNFIVSPAKYHYDINVIVIWPYALSTGNGDSLFFPVYITYPNGVNEIDISKHIKVYPNPTSDHVLVDSDMAIEEVRVYGSNGQLVLYEKQKQLINIETLPKGMYLFEVTLESGKKQSIRIIKE